MPRPICTDCKSEMRPHKNGFIVAYVTRIGYHETAQGDAYKCPTCEHITVTGFGNPYHNPDTSHADLVITV